MRTARPYQAEALRCVGRELSRVQSTLLVLATGLGKTFVFAEDARAADGRVMVVAHRKELLDQARDELRAVAGEDVGMERAEERADASPGGPRLVVGSVQTLAEPGRLRRWRPEQFARLVIDEAHHSPAASYRRLIAHFLQADRCRLFGTTATPRRGDKVPMSGTYRSVAYELGVLDGIEDGWLCPVVQEVVEIQDVDFSHLSTVAGDFHQGQLEEEMTKKGPLHGVAKAALDRAGDRQTLVFCVGVRQAQLLAELMARYRPGSVGWASGPEHQPDAERRAVVERFRQGRLQVVCNAALLTEGFDAPATACVVMARPTKSLSVYLQALGRGTRPWPGVVDAVPYDAPDAAERRRAAVAASPKPVCTVVDFCGNAHRHAKGIITALDALGGDHTAAVRAYAHRSLAGLQAGAPVETALAVAAEDLALIEEEQKRLARLKARVTYSTQTVGLDGAGAGGTARPLEVREPLSEKQLAALIRLGMAPEKAARLSKQAARGVQCRLLRERGRIA